MTNKELLLCPFCGGEARMVSTNYGRFIRCDKCYMGKHGKKGRTKNERIPQN